MTKAHKPITRETESTIRSRGHHYPIIVTLRSGGMVLDFRLKKHQQSYSLPVSWCFVEAVRAQIEADRRAKKEARKKK
jgi:hypothetical protein